MGGMGSGKGKGREKSRQSGAELDSASHGATYLLVSDVHNRSDGCQRFQACSSLRTRNSKAGAGDEQIFVVEHSGLDVEQAFNLRRA
jgi:hypothetical protein